MPSTDDPGPVEEFVDRAPHALDAAAVERLLATDRLVGLRSAEAAERLARFGPNRLMPLAAVPAAVTEAVKALQHTLVGAANRVVGRD